MACGKISRIWPERRFELALVVSLSYQSCQSESTTTTLYLFRRISTRQVSLQVMFCCESFLPRDAMRKSAVFAAVRCPSVCLTRWCIVPTWLKISLNFFLGPINPIILVFFNLKRCIPNSNPFSWGTKYTGVKKIATRWAMILHLYRATLCVSAVFAVGRCPSACPSVCLSVCHVRVLYPDG